MFSSELIFNDLTATHVATPGVPDKQVVISKLPAGDGKFKFYVNRYGTE